MAKELRLKEITLSGFRGYGNSKNTLKLSDPVVVLLGGNRSGKSSTLNAIEWALYGNEVVSASKMGIEERKGWLIKNRNCEKATVELILESEAGQMKIYRELSKGRKSKKQEFYFIDENGQRNDDEESLWIKLAFGPKDFMSSVYLHQEVIRDILVTRPSVRKSALDRLLGISDLRNILDALNRLKVGRYEDNISSIYEDLENSIMLKASVYKEQINHMKDKGKKFALNKEEYTAEGFRKKCEATLKLIRSLTRKAKIELEAIDTPSRPEEWGDFEEEVEGEIRRLRVENPGARSQKNLVEERNKLDSALAEYLGREKDLKDLRKEKRKIEREVGELGKIKSKKGQLIKKLKNVSERMEHISARINVVNETISYLEKLADKESKAPCPSCEKNIIPRLVLKNLQKRKEKIGAETEGLEKEKEKVRKSIKELDRVSERLNEIVEEDIPESKRGVDEALEDLAKVLGKKLCKRDDPEVAVQTRMDEIEKELDRNKELLNKYVQGLSKAEEMLEKSEVIGESILLEEKISKLNRVKRSKEWRQLNNARDKINKELEYIDITKDAVGMVLREVSQKKIQQAKSHIIDVYQKLVERPDFDEIEVNPDDYDVYAVKDGERERLLTFFNQGDMNCAALSIFLGLGVGLKAEGGLSFLMLDDPSQSLDENQKVRLAGVIDEIAGKTNVLLSTMDEALFQSVEKKVSKKKKVYRFREWDPYKGPTIVEK